MSISVQYGGSRVSSRNDILGASSKGQVGIGVTAGVLALQYLSKFHKKACLVAAASLSNLRELGLTIASVVAVVNQILAAFYMSPSLKLPLYVVWIQRPVLWIVSPRKNQFTKCLAPKLKLNALALKLQHLETCPMVLLIFCPGPVDLFHNSDRSRFQVQVKPKLLLPTDFTGLNK
ncbi:MAG: hypothetical protein EZS28_015432 [Streblomastix strix]|uniref:Uncharacterized protein n=1 Tax=Streblomastix strix TaxID=222440 RepID=A0A5J4W2W9_9EUKA|nr:MAG: hypothetical protein EZS28_015432 [Streblomastix strix]